MKRLLIFMMALICVVSMSSCSKGVSEDVEAAIRSECDRFIEEFDYSDKVLYEVHSMTYEIHEIKEKYDEILVDITWRINFDDTCIKEEGWDGDWIARVQHLLTLSELEVDGRKLEITHTNENYYDSVRVIVNGRDPYSGYDDYCGLVNPSKIDIAKDRLPGVTDENKCYRCMGTGKVVLTYGNSWSDEPGYGYGDKCGRCDGTGIDKN